MLAPDFCFEQTANAWVDHLLLKWHEHTPAFAETLFKQRIKQYIEPLNPNELLLKLLALPWKESSPGDSSAGVVFESRGLKGVPLTVSLDRLNCNTLIRLKPWQQDPKYLVGYVEVPNLEDVVLEETWLVSGQVLGRWSVVDFHPGQPLIPTRLLSTKCSSDVLLAKEAALLGFSVVHYSVKGITLCPSSL